MKRFHDKVYTLSQQGLLLWEPSWETFRPVQSVVWNPIHNQVEPYFGKYTHDIFDIHYGFGDSKMHDFCIQFTDDNAFDIGGAETIEDISEFWRWCKTKLQWVNDRGMNIHPCSTDPDRKKFILRYNLRAKTFRRSLRNLNGTRKIHTHQ
jgi:hypothetical protein